MPPVTPLLSEHPLLKDALWYAAAAGAVVGLTATEAEAQIVYTDVDPDELVMNGSLDIDFDGDGDPELAVLESSTRPQTIIVTETTAGPDVVDGMIGNGFPFGGFTYGYVLPLSEGAAISSANPDFVLLAAYQITSQATFTFYNSDPNGWLKAGEAFVGVRFILDGGAMHFGWIRVEMPSTGGEITVKDYAYEATAGEGIEAGAVGVAIEPGPDGTPGTHALTDLAPNPFAGRASFAVEVAETQAVNIEVYDTLGQRVATLHDGALAAGAAHRFALDAADLASGVYVVRVTGERFSDVRTVTLAR